MGGGGEGGYKVSLTHCDKLLIVVQGVRRVLLDGCNIKRGAKSNNEEERQSSGKLPWHDAPVDSIKLQVLDVVQAVDLPERTRLLIALQHPFHCVEDCIKAYKKFEHANSTFASTVRANR